MEAAVTNMTWLYVPLEAVIFLAFSAAMWLLVIRRADTGQDAAGANQVTPARVTTARDADELAASQRRAA